MNHYDPQRKDSFVWPMIPKNAKPGSQTSYKLTKFPNPSTWEQRGYELAGPCQMGRYDEEGFYHTYKPPVEGCFPGKYVRVLQKDQLEKAKNDYERDVINRRYGGSLTDSEAIL